MADLTFNDIINGKWYVFPGFYDNDDPTRIYKTIYNGEYYIKSISVTDQQEIISVPNNQPIFREPIEDELEMLDDDEDQFSDDDYSTEIRRRKTIHFNKFPFGTPINLTQEQCLELYNIFMDIERQHGGKRKKSKKTPEKRKRKTRRNASKKRKNTIKKRKNTIKKRKSHTRI